MSVGFGFSAGDFIAAIKLVGEVIDALKDTGDASRECRLLLRQLLDLETALIHVRRLEFTDAQADQANALKHAALRCRITIDEFMSKIQKYQPHLTSDRLVLGSSVRRSWYKVKWALCKREDVEKFKADVSGHTEALNILMNAIQIQQMTLESRDRAEQHSSLKVVIQNGFVTAMQKLATISDLITTSITNTKELLAITTQTAQIDCKIFAVVLDVQEHLKRAITPQILRNQPVYFVDALGIQSPFYLEFIRSKEAFLAVLCSNMQGHEPAIERINEGDFAISDTATNQDLDLSRPWQILFRSGQRADMSMILNEPERSGSVCPSCKVRCPGANDKDVECTNCGLTYRRLAPVLDLEETEAPYNRDSGLGRQRNSPAIFGPENFSRKRKRGDLDDELMLYRKVRLRTPLLLPASESHKIMELEHSGDNTIYDLIPPETPDIRFTTCIEAHGKDPMPVTRFEDLRPGHDVYSRMLADRLRKMRQERGESETTPEERDRIVNELRAAEGRKAEEKRIRAERIIREYEQVLKEKTQEEMELRERILREEKELRERILREEKELRERILREEEERQEQYLKTNISQINRRITQPQTRSIHGKPDFV